MAKKPKQLSMYEEDLVWMSYRYCIGRHTIAAAMHAGNIASNAYSKLSKARRNFMAFDIRREIDSQLSFSQANFFIDTCLKRQDNPNYRPLEMFLEIVNSNGIKNGNDYKKVKSIHVDDNGSSVEYKDDGSVSSIAIGQDIYDLVPWMKLANLFDSSTHKMLSLRNPETGETATVECFRTPVLRSCSTFEYDMRWVPVEKHISNPAIETWADEDFIVSIDDVKE